MGADDDADDADKGGEDKGYGTGGGGGGKALPADWKPDAWVPKDRFQAVVGEKQKLSTRVVELESETQTLSERAATADTLAKAVASEKARADAAEEKFVVYTEIAGALGKNDPAIVDLFDGQYRKLPAKDRPTRAAWVAQLQADIADEEKAATIQSVLAPFLGRQAADKGNGTEQKTQARNPGGGGGGDGAQAPDAKLIAAAAEKGRKTGDWADYKALRAKTRWAPAADG